LSAERYTRRRRIRRIRRIRTAYHEVFLLEYFEVLLVKRVEMKGCDKGFHRLEKLDQPEKSELTKNTSIFQRNKQSAHRMPVSRSNCESDTPGELRALLSGVALRGHFA
jgi:hypothetical protein